MQCDGLHQYLFSHRLPFSPRDELPRERIGDPSYVTKRKSFLQGERVKYFKAKKSAKAAARAVKFWI
jgi:hypothetical protein